VANAAPWNIRRATADDIEALVRLRVAMMAETNGHDGDAESPSAALAEANRTYMRGAVTSGEFVAYVAEADSVIIAASGVTLYRTAPNSGNLSGVQAYILNMYTLPEWRGRGLASALVERLAEHARSAGATRVALRATDAGRSVYERLGFTSDSQFMHLRIARHISPE
jgi:GNAT superfamily N-acetyltransferase